MLPRSPANFLSTCGGDFFISGVYLIVAQAGSGRHTHTRVGLSTWQGAHSRDGGPSSAQGQGCPAAHLPLMCAWGFSLLH